MQLKSKRGQIITKRVEMRVASNMIKHYQNKGYDIQKKENGRFNFKQTVLINVKDLPLYSEAIIEYQCAECGKIAATTKRDIVKKVNKVKLKCQMCSVCDHTLGEKFKQYAPGNRLYTRYARSARARQLDFELTSDEFEEIISRPCFFCGGYGKPSHNGIDRIDNSKGYIKSNCVPCCSFCNLMKHKHSLDEFLSKIKQIYSYSVSRRLVKSDGVAAKQLDMFSGKKTKDDE